jgi:hypothetical protein
MVLNIYQGLQVCLGKEQEIKEGLYFYCKKPGHIKANYEEKKVKDAQFGGNFRPRNLSYPLGQSLACQYTPRLQYPSG